MKVLFRIILPILTLITAIAWLFTGDPVIQFIGVPFGTIVGTLFLIFVLAGLKKVDRAGQLMFYVSFGIFAVIGLSFCITTPAYPFLWITQLLWLGTMIWAKIWFSRHGSDYKNIFGYVNNSEGGVDDGTTPGWYYPSNRELTYTYGVTPDGRRVIHWNFARSHIRWWTGEHWDFSKRPPVNLDPDQVRQVRAYKLVERHIPEEDRVDPWASGAFGYTAPSRRKK